MSKAKPVSFSITRATRRSTAITDHWAFLDDIESPTRADLTLEAQFMDQDIDDAWFRTSHPVHQMSSRRLKSCFPRCFEESLVLPDVPCRSPRLPDSVSRSRGKDYKTRKWVGAEHLLLDKLHPIRKLGGKTVTGQDASGSNSSSTVTTSSSQKKTISNVVDLKRSSSSKSSSTVNTNSVGSVVSKHVSGNPNQSLRGPNSTSSDAKCSLRGEVKGDRRSTSSKSSVGSSYSLERKLEGVDSAALQAAKRRVQNNEDSRLVNILKEPKRQIPDRISSSKNQKKVSDAKVSVREPKPKGLSSALPRKPLHPVNEAVPAKVRTVALATQPRQSAAAGKLNSVSVGNQKVVAERKNQYSKTLKPSGTGLGKTNEGKSGTNTRSVGMRAFR